MNDQKLPAPSPSTRTFTKPHSVEALAKSVFAAEAPEQYIRTLPAQSIYMAIRHNGIHSSADLIDLATLEQCRLLLDFDLWENDRFVEENFYDWLELADEDTGLMLLQKILKVIDLKIIAMEIGRHVIVESFEDQTDQPPGPGFFTPDKGYTWLFISAEDGTKHFLLGRLLALIFETSADLFYQLLSIPGAHTESIIEEEAYQDRRVRLTEEGIPDKDHAHELNSQITDLEITKAIKDRDSRATIAPDVMAVEPLLHISFEPEPLKTLLRSVISDETFQSELTLVLNGAIVYFSVPFYDEAAVRSIIVKVKGAINVGLERVITTHSITADEAYQVLGVQKLYRLGLTQIFGLRKDALKLHEATLNERDDGAQAALTLRALRETFPVMPLALKIDASFETVEGSLSQETKPICLSAELDAIHRVLWGN